VASLVTLGAPHNGAPIALAGIAGLHKTNFLSIRPSQRLANDDRCPSPSLYQLAPASTQHFIWDGKRSSAHATYAADVPRSPPPPAIGRKAWRRGNPCARV